MLGRDQPACEMGPMTLRIACIGKHGQTAQALAAVAAHDSTISLVQAGSKEADLRDAASLARFIDAAKPDAVINAGAYNLVDRAESEQAQAYAVNADGPLALARIARERGIAFIHMSTDCVFDGRGTEAHDEDETPNPLSVYGASKLAGELAVADEYPEALTLRVCWVFSEFGDSFISKAIGWARDRPVLRIVSDQIGPPTYAPDIATALLRIAREKVDGASDLSGLLHLASPEAMSRSDMATAIMAESKRLGGPFAEIDAVTSETFNAPAKRPLNARLSSVRATARLGLSWTPWREALERSVAGVLKR